MWRRLLTFLPTVSSYYLRVIDWKPFVGIHSNAEEPRVGLSINSTTIINMHLEYYTLLKDKVWVLHPVAIIHFFLFVSHKSSRHRNAP